MDNAYFLYIWLAHQLILIAAFVLRHYKVLQQVRETPDGLEYEGWYYNARRVFAVLACSLVFYLVFLKWLAGWRIDNWWLEASLVLVTLALGDMLFIAARSPALFTDRFTRLRGWYTSFIIIFIASFYTRLVLGVLSMFSYSTAFADAILPSPRYNDLYLFNDYYLSCSVPRGIVVTKKIFIFSKDVTDAKVFTRSLCNFHAFDFVDSEDSWVPFPFVQRNKTKVIVLTNPQQKRGYLDITLEKTGALSISGYIYATTDARISATYMPCGTIKVE